MIRLVATDLDGTLLRSDGTVSEVTRAVLREVDALGIPVVFVTARPLRWMEDLWPLVGSHGHAVVSNGAITYDVPAREVGDVAALPRDVGLSVCAAIRETLPSAAYALEALGAFCREASYVEPLPDPIGTRIGPIEQIWPAEPVVKLLVRADVRADDLRVAVQSAVGAAVTVTWSGDGLMEISAAEVTKAVALARVCQALDVPATDVVAFGDMPNDVAMLQWAGLGLAVANADPAVLAVADRVVGHHDADGVARALVDLFALNPTSIEATEFVGSESDLL